KCHTYHMALPLKLMHFRLCVGLCLKYCGAFRAEISTTSHILSNVWSVLNIFHPPFIETQSLVFSAKNDTCHMALPLKIIHFRLSDHLCLKYCGAFRDANLNYFTYFILCLECSAYIPPPCHSH